MPKKFSIFNFQFLKPKGLLLLPLLIVLLAAGCNQIQTQNSKNNNQQQNQNQTSKTPQVQKLSVTQTVEGSNLNQAGPYRIEEGKTAMDLLKSTHRTTTKEFSGVGEFVESIDGIKPDSSRFWAFYVNGQSSNVGASSYQLKNNDKIEWKLEAIK